MNSLDDLFRRLEQLNEIGISLSRERELPRLLESILVAAKDITHADGGTLYRTADEGRVLRFEIIRTDSLGIAMGGTSGTPIGFPDIPLHDPEGMPNERNVVACAVHRDSTIVVDDAYAERGFDFAGTRLFDQRTGYRSRSFLTVPMKNHEGEIIGVLQLINARDPKGDVVGFSDADRRLAESLASQAAIALTNRQLIDQLEVLFESFINLINVAIDEKSPYTHGHCERVPELTMMIAQAVNDVQEGPLAEFRMSDQDRYELKIAGMLHDCGKVTTPVHVVDKGTKLETIFDRIHLVDTRFEVLKRDAEIAALRRQLAIERGEAEGNCEAVRHECDDELRMLEEEREFLRRCNIGGEAMSPDDQQRVRDIGTVRKWRNVDGVITEFLVHDEIENLSIRAGTLTARERETINYHIVATIRMLEKLPWPRHLRNVTEYAGGHHERMDGKGYPRGLSREQMSLQARMMGIADIFEALTATDRPYKKGMKLSQAMNILGNFRRNGHIDPDIFEVFVREKVYLRYAERFLEASQCDAVDESALLP